jgi:glycosyltransferase involved in cell wall biosynthesis
MKDIFFSVVIPTYNRASFISTAIQSVLSQSYINFELIIIDDGSTDNTENIIKSIRSDKIKYYKKENAERAAARNYGIEKAHGDYVTFLDSDDIYYSNYLQNAFESIVKYNQPPFLHLAYEVKNLGGETIMQFNKIRSGDYKILLKPNILSCMGVFIRNDITQNFRFNENRDLSGTEDWELWMRIVANHGIIADNRISSCCIDHDDRSVLEVSETKLVQRKELAINYAFKDIMVKKKYEKYLNIIKAHSNTYIALHLCLAGKFKEALKYLKKAVLSYPFIIFDKRIFAITKLFFQSRLNVL